MCVAIGQIYRKQRYSVIRRETEAMISLSKIPVFLNKFCGLTRECICFHSLCKQLKPITNEKLMRKLSIDFETKHLFIQIIDWDGMFVV